MDLEQQLQGVWERDSSLRVGGPLTGPERQRPPADPAPLHPPTVGVGSEQTSSQRRSHHLPYLWVRRVLSPPLLTETPHLTSPLALNIGRTEENTRSGLGLPHLRRVEPVTMATAPRATPEEKAAKGDHFSAARGRGVRAINDSCAYFSLSVSAAICT